MSGRREAQVLADARLIGQTSYIYEAGCGVVIDGERTYLTGDWRRGGRLSPAERMLEAGRPGPALRALRRPARVAPPVAHGPRPLAPVPRRRRRRRGERAARASAGHDDLRFLDNGAISTPMEGIEVPHAYHLVPGGASKAKAVAFHVRARGYAPEECIAVGDSLEDLEAADAVGPLLRGRQRARRATRACARRSSRFANVTVTEGAMGDGFYEAVVSTLAERGWHYHRTRGRCHRRRGGVPPDHVLARGGRAADHRRQHRPGDAALGRRPCTR